jgi:hypothetical protein
VLEQVKFQLLVRGYTAAVFLMLRLQERKKS